MAARGDLTCRELVEFVNDYLEGELSPDGRARFEAHLVCCVGCGNYVRQMRWTVALVGALREDHSAPQAFSLHELRQRCSGFG